ncbi:MAG TPA: heavy metal-associated domain-containing protein [Candidatus Acidoferrum sp.]
MCAHAVRVSLKSVAGIEKVDVSLEKGLAVITLKTGNTVTLKQLQEAITKNGFTMKASKVSVAGQIVMDGEKARLKISGSNDLLTLVAGQGPAVNLDAMNGKNVMAQGTINEGPKGQVPDTLVYNSMVVEEPR